MFQVRPDKAMSVPLSLEQQQLHKLSFSPKSLSHEGLGPDKSLSGGGSAGEAGGAKWRSREGFSSGGSGRKGSGGSGGSSLGKEKLASRLRQREQLGNMLVMAEREMVDTELFSYREDLENQDCMTQMDDLQVSELTLLSTVSLFKSTLYHKFTRDSYCTFYHVFSEDSYSLFTTHSTAYPVHRPAHCTYIHTSLPDHHICSMS